MTDLTSLRLSYTRAELRRDSLDPDPLRQFQRWLDEAIRDGLREPYALSLATADAHGWPSVRTVLLRGADERGLTFYSNYDSHKGQDLKVNCSAEMLFYWAEHERQVRASGYVKRVSEEESTAYFHARPRESQLAAHVSNPQSAPIESREALEAKLAELHVRYPEGTPVPKPDFWGGYRVEVMTWEFWQGRPNRMHDRFRYEQAWDGWRIERLMP